LDERVERLEWLVEEMVTNIDRLTHAVITLQNQLDLLATSNKKRSPEPTRKRRLRIVKSSR